MWELFIHIYNVFRNSENRKGKFVRVSDRQLGIIYFLLIQTIINILFASAHLFIEFKTKGNDHFKAFFIGTLIISFILSQIVLIKVEKKVKKLPAKDNESTYWPGYFLLSQVYFVLSLVLMFFTVFLLRTE